MTLMNRLIIGLVFFIVSNSADEKLRLTVYYASKCSDSRSFIQQQLRPAMRQLHEHVRMRFVPFGKATSIDYRAGGFKCQHGASECYWNMVHDCTVHIMKFRTDLEILDYVACEIEYQTHKDCSQKAGVPINKLRACINSDRGIVLQLASEYHTSKIQPIKFVPAITINDKYDQSVQDLAMKDLKKALCGFLKNVSACSGYYNLRNTTLHLIQQL